MSDEPFRRPGSVPGTQPVPVRPRPDEWQLTSESVIDAPAPAIDSEPDLPVHGRPASPIRNNVIVGLAGLLVGVAIGAIFISRLDSPPLSISRDTFPGEVLGELREDATTTLVEGVDSQLQDDIERYRFAYGGDGARFTYGTYALTIVNGQMSTILPSRGDADSGEEAWVVSLRSDQTSCVSEEPPGAEPPPFQLSELLDDDSKDVFFWLDEGRTKARTECVLFDEDRNVSLRLEGSGWVDNNAKTAGWFRDELVAIHADLID